jgi:aspartate racemase
MLNIGMIGGLSWQSTAEYYRIINETLNQKLGGHHSARCSVVSVNFDPVLSWMEDGNWDCVAAVMTDAAESLEACGADFFLFCCNTVHKVAEQVQARVGIPLLHIADAAAESIKAARVRKVGLLGSTFTMEQDFYRGRLAAAHGIEVLVPELADGREVHRIAVEELDFGVVLESSRRKTLSVMENLTARGAEAIVLGCTELSLLIKQQHTDITVFDTSLIHAQTAVARALAGKEGGDELTRG